MRNPKYTPRPAYNRAALEADAHTRFAKENPEASPEARAAATATITGGLDALDSLLSRGVTLRVAAAAVMAMLSFDHDEPHARLH